MKNPRLAALVLGAGLIASGCITRVQPAHITPPDELIVITEQPHYIVKQVPGKQDFVILADTQSIAREAAKKVLKCGEQICMITPRAVIVIVTKPSKQ